MMELQHRPDVEQYDNRPLLMAAHMRRPTVHVRALNTITVRYDV